MCGLQNFPRPEENNIASASGVARRPAWICDCDDRPHDYRHSQAAPPLARDVSAAHPPKASNLDDGVVAWKKSIRTSGESWPRIRPSLGAIFHPRWSPRPWEASLLKITPLSSYGPTPRRGGKGSQNPRKRGAERGATLGDERRRWAGMECHIKCPFGHGVGPW